VIKMRVLNERGGHFAALRNSTVLIYWPHGLGDWVHLGTILPLLEPSNRYFVTRFGDDFVSVIEGNAYARPLYSGARKLSDGAEQGARHLGIDPRRVAGALMDVALPDWLERHVRLARIDTLFYTDYPEPEGRAAFPFHTKARALAKSLVAAPRIAHFDLSKALASTIDFSVRPEINTFVESVLADYMQPADPLVLLALRGHTNERKAWPPVRARELIALLRARAARATFLLLDEGPVPPELAGAVFSFAELFRGEQPFAAIYKALLARAKLFIGVPAGPLHMASAYGCLPIIGIWQVHHPDWYDELNRNAVHLIGADVVRRGFARRPATVTKPEALKDTCEVVAQAVVPAQAVAARAYELL